MTFIHYKLTDEQLANKRALARRVQPRSGPASPPAPIVAVPEAQWPTWAKAVALLKTDADAGVGDTIHRQLGIFGKGFKAAMLAMGVPCGCDIRRAERNAEYPYKPLATNPETKDN